MNKVFILLLVNLIILMTFISFAALCYYTPPTVDNIFKLTTRAYLKINHIPANDEELSKNLRRLENLKQIDKFHILYPQKRELILSILKDLIKADQISEANTLIKYTKTLDEKDLTFKAVNIALNKNQELITFLAKTNFHPAILKELSIVLDSKDLNAQLCRDYKNNLEFNDYDFIEIYFKVDEIPVRQRIYNLNQQEDYKITIPKRTTEIKIIGPHYKAFTISNIKVANLSAAVNADYSIKTQHLLTSTIPNKFFSNFKEKTQVIITIKPSNDLVLTYDFEKISLSDFTKVNILGAKCA